MPLAFRLLIFLAALSWTGGVFAAEAPPGASSCSGCHPNSAGVDSPIRRLIDIPAGDIATAMRDYRAGQRPATIMDRVAKGFTDDEIAAIAAWYAARKD